MRLDPFVLDRARDPDGSRLRDLLRADFHAANLGNLRRILVHVLAAGGAALVAMVVDANLGSAGTRHDVALAWIAVATLAGGITAAETWWDRRRRALLDQLGVPER